jgi:hypothetical protein
VEQQLGDLVADREQRAEFGVDPAAERRLRSRVERGCRRGSPTADLATPA